MPDALSTDDNIMRTTPRIHYPGAWNVNTDLIDWKEIDGQPGNFIKVLALDENHHRVDFLFKQDPHKRFQKHTHKCTVATLTLDGEWGYEEGPERFFRGCFNYEVDGSAHTPYATELGMFLFASFQGDGRPFLELLDDDDNVSGTVDMDFFRDYYDEKL